VLDSAPKVFYLAEAAYEDEFFLDMKRIRRKLSSAPLARGNE
jgi:hypothetical protein